jgi:hypothetical protein
LANISEDFGIDMDRWTLDVEEDSDGNAFITLPPEVLEKKVIVLNGLFIKMGVGKWKK